jgi:hypothetical protein
MKQFDIKRFINVARWDLSVNSKFYTRSLLLIVVLCCFPILMTFLYAVITGNYLLTGKVYDNIQPFVFILALIGCFYSVIASGYMFHNLATKQGRINDLTLPATNFERFLWHFLVIAVGTQIVWLVGVICADLLHCLFRLDFPTLSGLSSQTRSFSAELFSKYFSWERVDFLGYNVMPLIVLMTYSFVRTFSLVNAWKYRHNIPLTVLLHFLLNNALGLIFIIFVTSNFANSRAFVEFIETLDGLNPEIVIIGLYVFFTLLYCGILYLTYWLYTRAQLTTKRNP